MITNEHTKAFIKEVVQETLLSLGIDTSNSEAVVEFQKDMHHSRTLRLRDTNSANTARHHGITMILSGIAAAIVLGVASFFGQIR